MIDQEDPLWWLHLEKKEVADFLKTNNITPQEYAKYLLEDVYETPPVSMREFLFSPDFCSFNGPDDLWPNVQAILEEFDHPSYREAHLGLGRGCVAKGTEVYDVSTGLWSKVEDIKKPFVAGSYVEDTYSGKYGEFLASHFYVSGKGNILELELGTGIKTKVYEGHMFLGRKWYSGTQPSRRNKTAWVKASDLKVGQLVAVSNKVTILDPIPMPEEEVRFMGYMIGDGHFPSRRIREVSWDLKGGGSNSKVYKMWGGAGFYCAYPNIKKAFSSVLEHLEVPFSVKPKSDNPGVDAFSFSMRRHPVMKKLMDKYELGGKTAPTKHIPDDFFRLPDSQIAILLEGLFTTDGWCCKWESGGKTKYQAGYCSKSKRLVEDIRKLLMRFGVSSKVYKKKSTGFRGIGDKGFAYQLLIVDNGSLRKFADKVTVIDCEEVLEEFKALPVGRLEGEDFKWVRVKSVKSIGEQDYYDCKVPISNNYIHDFGLIGHNSGKSMCSAVFLARSIYWLLNLKNPWKFYELRKDTLLCCLNVSVSGAQAQSVVFDNLSAIIENSSYFKGKFTKRTSLGHADFYFPSKHLKAISGHSGSTVWRGYAIYSGVADESCLAGSTRVLDVNSGLWTPVQDLSGKRIKVSSFDSVSGKCVEGEGEVVYRGLQPVFKLTFTGGRSIKATSKHRFLTKGIDFYRSGRTTWKRLEELKEGDKLRLSTESPGWARIVSIKPGLIEPTYDVINVEPHNNFIAEGLVVHNSWFVAKNNKDNAEEIYDVLKGSMYTRFPNSYKLMLISSLKSKNDFLCKSLINLRKNSVEHRGIENLEIVKKELGIDG